MQMMAYWHKKMQLFFFFSCFLFSNRLLIILVFIERGKKRRNGRNLIEWENAEKLLEVKNEKTHQVFTTFAPTKS